MTTHEPASPHTPDYHTSIAFHHTDAAGIVHFANYFLFAEEAETHTLSVLGLPGPQTGMYYPRVHVEADYVAPLYFRDAICVRPSLTAIGRSSLHWKFCIYGPNGLAATVTAISARRNAANQAAPYSEEERTQLRSLLNSKTTTPETPPAPPYGAPAQKK